MKLYSPLYRLNSIDPKPLGYRRYYKLRWLASFFCRHLRNATYTRSTGSSYMDDSFRGQVCIDCGTILAEEQTY
jgi:hypothetical protein